MRKILCNTLIIIFMLGVCFNGYFIGSGLSFDSSINVYAEDDNPGIPPSSEWQNSDLSMQAQAFIAYCKSNNLVISGSALDAITTVTTEVYNKLCNVIGLSPTELQAEIKYATDDNLGLRFLFTQTGATAMNRIFSEFLMNNDLSVGDTVEDKELFNGKIFTDSEGRSCSVYVVKTNSASFMSASDLFAQEGSVYRFGSSELANMPDVYSTSTQSPTFYVNDIPYYFFFDDFRKTTVPTYRYFNMHCGSYNPTLYTRSRSNFDNCDAWLSFAIEPDGHLWFCAIRHQKSGNYYYSYNRLYDFTSNDISHDISDEDVTVSTVNNTNITNNNYTNNNYTIIYNDGDTYYTDDDDEPSPDTPPGGGGNDPEDPLDPYDPAKPFPDTPDNPTPDPGLVGSPGSDGTITIPDFNFDIPDINWSLDGLQHKFPFSLPFDLYNACKLLNAEPETPELDYTVDLVVYQWPVNYDLHWLDPAARVIRIFELLAFVVGLILITRHIIGG